MYTGLGWKRPLRQKLRGSGKDGSANKLTRLPIQVQINESGELVSGRVFLLDMKVDSMNVFLHEPLSRKEKVFVVVQGHRHLYVQAQVVWCSLSSLSTRVISEETFRYRAKLKLIYDTNLDRNAVLRFQEELSS